MRIYYAVAAACALALALGNPRGAIAQTPSSDSFPNITAVNLLQQSHDLAQQLPPPMRTMLLQQQTQTAERIQPDLARDWANELFTLSLQAKDAQRAMIQRFALKVLVRVDPEHAPQLLDRLPAEEPDSRTATSAKLDLAVQVFGQVVTRDGPGALPALEQEAALLGAQGNYPYAALGYAAMQATTKDWGHDDQHAIQVLDSVFVPAFARYRQGPHTLPDDIEFGKMLQVFAGGLPLETVKPALHTLVENLLAVDASKYHLATKLYTTDGQTATADNTIDATLLFFGTLIDRDSELAEQLESTRPALRPALEYATAGRQRMMTFGGAQSHNLARPDPQEEGLDAVRFSHINPEVAIAKVEHLPPGDKRTAMMLQIARDIAGDHPDQAAHLIADSQAGSITTNAGNQLDLISAQSFLAAVQQDQDKDALRELLRRGFDAAAHLIAERQGTKDDTPISGLGPLIQIGIQNETELTTNFLQSLPASSMKARLLMGAASAIALPRPLPFRSQPAQKAAKSEAQER